MRASGLRGREGQGARWLQVGFMPPDDGRPRYLIVNADESEPGACKDRDIMQGDPHLLIEGCLIASRAIGSAHGLDLHSGQYIEARERLEAAILEARAAGLSDRTTSTTGISGHRLPTAAGLMSAASETALIESLEGKKGQPRIRPPYPATNGLYGCPTTVNNVESIAVVGTILRRGADWFSAIGRPGKCRHEGDEHLGPREDAPAMSRKDEHAAAHAH